MKINTVIYLVLAERQNKPNWIVREHRRRCISAVFSAGDPSLRGPRRCCVMKKFNTDDMAHKIPRGIEWVTSIHTLQPGDILATGTNHRGLNPFMDGDKIVLACEGCGTLHITVRDDLKRTWSRITRLQHKQSGADSLAPAAPEKKRQGAPAAPRDKRCNNHRRIVGCMLSGARRVHPVIVGWSPPK